MRPSEKTCSVGFLVRPQVFREILDLSLGQLVCQFQPAAAVGRLDRLDRVPHRRGVAGERDHHFGGVVERDDHRAFLAAHRIDQGLGLALGLVEPGVLVAVEILHRRHRRRAVDEDHRELRQPRRIVRHRSGEGQAQQREQEQLQQEQQVPPQLLERGIDLQILNRLAPEDRRRHRQLAAAELEEVQREQRRHRDGGGDGGGGGVEEAGEPGHVNPFRSAWQSPR